MHALELWLEQLSAAQLLAVVICALIAGGFVGALFSSFLEPRCNMAVDGDIDNWRHACRTATIACVGSGYANTGEITKKSFDLLRSWLSKSQLEDFNVLRHFDVIGSRTGTRYRISQRSSFNVEELSSAGYPIAMLCFIPQGAHAMGDIMLAQKVMLETDEPSALKIANRSSRFRSDVYAGLVAATQRSISLNSIWRRLFEQVID